MRDESPALLQAVINLRSAQQAEDLMRVRQTAGY